MLSRYPEFADKCDCAKLDGKEWSLLLKYRLRFAEKCEWDKLNGEDWKFLLTERPQFVDKCDWSKLTKENVLHVLCNHPELQKYCPNELCPTEDELKEAEKGIFKRPWFTRPEW